VLARSFAERFIVAVKPLVVNITSKRSHLSALRTYEIECLSSGSRPEAVITWWKGTHQVKHMARNVSMSSSRRPLGRHGF